MSSPTLVEGIRNVLVTAGLTNSFCVEIPSSVVDGVAVLAYGGTADSEIPVSRVSVQVKARSASYTEAERLAWVAFKALESALPVCDRTVIRKPIPRQEPFFLMRDEDGNYVQAFNLDYLCLRK